MGLFSALSGSDEICEARFVFDRNDFSMVSVEIVACEAWDRYVKEHASDWSRRRCPGNWR